MGLLEVEVEVEGELVVTVVLFETGIELVV